MHEFLVRSNARLNGEMYSAFSFYPRMLHQSAQDSYSVASWRKLFALQVSLSKSKEYHTLTNHYYSFLPFFRPFYPYN